MLPAIKGLLELPFDAQWNSAPHPLKLSSSRLSRPWASSPSSITSATLRLLRAAETRPRLARKISLPPSDRKSQVTLPASSHLAHHGCDRRRHLFRALVLHYLPRIRPRGRKRHCTVRGHSPQDCPRARAAPRRSPSLHRPLRKCLRFLLSHGLDRACGPQRRNCGSSLDLRRCVLHFTLLSSSASPLPNISIQTSLKPCRTRRPPSFMMRCTLCLTAGFPSRRWSRTGS